jgi:hypothetical protein
LLQRQNSSRERVGSRLDNQFWWSLALARTLSIHFGLVLDEEEEEEEEEEEPTVIFSKKSFSTLT